MRLRGQTAFGCYRLRAAMVAWSALVIAGLLPTSTLLAQAKPPQANSSPAFAALAAKAQAARDADQLDQAVALYKKALALRPRWAEGWWSLGTSEYDLNSYKEAAEAFRTLVALQPKSGTALVMLGLCQFELGDDDAALNSLTEGRRLGVTSEPQLRTVVMYHEGVLLQRKGRFEASEEILGQLCRQTPYPPEIDLVVGAIALRVRDRQLPAEGTVEYQVMQQTGRATCLGIQRKYEEGSQQFEVLLASHSSYPNLHYAFGKLLLDANDGDGAVKQFQAEIQNNPNDVNSRLRIAAAKYHVDSAGGLPYAEEAVKLDPAQPLGHYLLGLLLLDTDDYLRAIPNLEIAEKAFPDQPKVYFALASAYSRAGRKEDATRARETFLRLNKEQESQSTAADGSAVPPKR